MAALQRDVEDEFACQGLCGGDVSCKGYNYVFESSSCTMYSSIRTVAPTGGIAFGFAAADIPPSLEISHVLTPLPGEAGSVCKKKDHKGDPAAAGSLWREFFDFMQGPGIILLTALSLLGYFWVSVKEASLAFKHSAAKVLSPAGRKAAAARMQERMQRQSRKFEEMVENSPTLRTVRDKTLLTLSPKNGVRGSPKKKSPKKKKKKQDQHGRGIRKRKSRLYKVDPEEGVGIEDEQHRQEEEDFETTTQHQADRQVSDILQKKRETAEQKRKKQPQSRASTLRFESEAEVAEYDYEDGSSEGEETDSSSDADANLDGIESLEDAEGVGQRKSFYKKAVTRLSSMFQWSWRTTRLSFQESTTSSFFLRRNNNREKGPSDHEEKEDTSVEVVTTGSKAEQEGSASELQHQADDSKAVPAGRQSKSSMHRPSEKSQSGRVSRSGRSRSNADEELDKNATTNRKSRKSEQQGNDQAQAPSEGPEPLRQEDVVRHHENKMKIEDFDDDLDKGGRGTGSPVKRTIIEES
ncbi:unnamed protein product [Amoebophrya sp. A120]|nr:unnamed protein product [Amoebophrya sp. A120]|eukprot:GSA120T00011548001.1